MKARALLIGINDYADIKDLNGCLNDVTNLRDVLLSYFGFAVNDISVLTDSSATKERIERRIKWLLSGLRSGDRAVFHFSGHGSYIRDFSGDEADRKFKDEVDELICLYDMDWRNADSYLIDDELGKLFGQAGKGVKLTVILDSCHSGTGTRAFGPPPDLAGHPGFPSAPASTSREGRQLQGDRHAGAPAPQVQNRFVPPPVDIQARIDERHPPATRRILRGNDTNGLNHLLLAGCRDDQTSADAHILGSYNGAFTYYLCKTIRDMGPELTYSELTGRVRQSLKFNGYDQVPQCEGAFVDENIFA